MLLDAAAIGGLPVSKGSINLPLRHPLKCWQRAGQKPGERRGLPRPPVTSEPIPTVTEEPQRPRQGTKLLFLPDSPYAKKKGSRVARAGLPKPDRYAQAPLSPGGDCRRSAAPRGLAPPRSAAPPLTSEGRGPPPRPAARRCRRDRPRRPGLRCPAPLPVSPPRPAPAPLLPAAGPARPCLPGERRSVAGAQPRHPRPRPRRSPQPGSVAEERLKTERQGTRPARARADAFSAGPSGAIERGSPRGVPLRPIRDQAERASVKKAKRNRAASQWERAGGGTRGAGLPRFKGALSQSVHLRDGEQRAALEAAVTAGAMNPLPEPVLKQVGVTKPPHEPQR